MFKRGVSLIILIVFIVVFTSAFVMASTAAIVKLPFRYSFNVDGVLQESASEMDSSSPYWWLNSGAILNISNGRGRTVIRELASTNKWRLEYLASNPIDTDNGYHPQNLFRLITRSKWQNVAQGVYFRVVRDQFSSSPNRDVYNGLLLMSRYQDSDNLYYAGVRVDGNAIIKKKLNGVYYTLASKKVFSGTYDRVLKPSLLPKNKWIGLKSVVNNTKNGVNIKLYLDLNWNANWTLILEANDYGSNGQPIVNQGFGGIRTDFMDVEFDDYKMLNINSL